MLNKISHVSEIRSHIHFASCFVSILDCFADALERARPSGSVNFRPSLLDATTVMNFNVPIVWFLDPFCRPDLDFKDITPSASISVSISVLWIPFQGAVEVL